MASLRSRSHKVLAGTPGSPGAKLAKTRLLRRLIARRRRRQLVATIAGTTESRTNNYRGQRPGTVARRHRCGRERARVASEAAGRDWDLRRGGGRGRGQVAAQPEWRDLRRPPRQALDGRGVFSRHAVWTSAATTSASLSRIWPKPAAAPSCSSLVAVGSLRVKVSLVWPLP